MERPIQEIAFGGPFVRQGDRCEANDHVAFGGVMYLYNNPEQFQDQIAKRRALLSTPEADGAVNQNFERPIGTLFDDLDTDKMIPAHALFVDDLDTLGDRALIGMPPEFGIQEGTLKELQGAVLVGGKHFGKGSSREQAVTALLSAGFSAILAESFGPIFLDNAVNAGLLTSANVGLADAIQRGTSVPLSEFLKDKNPLQQHILLAGGLFSYLLAVKAGKIPRPEIPKDRVPRPMTIWEKRVARVLNVPSVIPGDTAFLPVHEACSYVPLSGPARQAMLAAYGEVRTTVTPQLFEDHFPLSNHPEVPLATERQRHFAQELGVPPDRYHKGLKRDGGGSGIIHQVLLETLDPRSKQTVIITDSHTPKLGVLPFVALPVGSMLWAAGVAEGEIPFTVKKTLRVELSGKLPPGVTIRDAQLELGSTYQPMKDISIVEFGGNGLDTLTVGQVSALCNMVPEIFLAECAVTEAYSAGLRFLNDRHTSDAESARALFGNPDPGCEYVGLVEFDLSKTTPWIALPGNPRSGIPLRELREHPAIQKAYVASCTCALDDLKEAAAVLRDRSVAPNTRMIIIPSSRAVHEEAERRGYLDILRLAGARVHDEIACGPCIGDGPDAVQPGETAISATNRNFRGRMDPSKQGRGVYLGGAILTSLSAMKGHIVSAEEYQEEIGWVIENLERL